MTSATIRMHRYQAFSDIPVFIRDYCKTTSASPGEEIDSLYLSREGQATNSEAPFRIVKPASIRFIVR